MKWSGWTARTGFTWTRRRHNRIHTKMIHGTAAERIAHAKLPGCHLCALESVDDGYIAHVRTQSGTATVHLPYAEIEAEAARKQAEYEAALENAQRVLH